MDHFQFFTAGDCFIHQNFPLEFWSLLRWIKVYWYGGEHINIADCGLCYGLTRICIFLNSVAWSLLRSSIEYSALSYIKSGPSTIQQTTIEKYKVQ